MNRLFTIKKILAFLLLLVFTFSITPKRFLHDLFATHQESYAKKTKSSETQVSKLGFQCDCDKLLVTSPFVQSSSEIRITHFPSYSNPRIEKIIFIYSGSPVYVGLRGPPVNG